MACTAGADQQAKIKLFNAAIYFINIKQSLYWDSGAVKIFRLCKKIILNFYCRYI